MPCSSSLQVCNATVFSVFWGCASVITGLELFLITQSTAVGSPPCPPPPWQSSLFSVSVDPSELLFACCC